MSDSNVPLTSRIQSRLRARHAKNEQWRRNVQAMNVDGVRQLADISDEELIAPTPAFPAPATRWRCSVGSRSR
jgi:hypothetical protein